MICEKKPLKKISPNLKKSGGKMKCIRCGKEVPDDTIICNECGFDFDEYYNNRSIITVEEDPIVPENQKSSLVDNPILTFIFGLLSIPMTFIFIVSSTIVIIYLVGVILLVFLTLFMSRKPCKVKLKPVRNVGKWMAYFSINLIVFKVVYDIIGKLFFK